MSAGGRLPDPGLAAVCVCGEPREAHGGSRHYGACPGEHGLYAKRFRLRDEDKPGALNQTVTVSLSDPVAMLGSYTVGIRLDDPLGYLRVDGEVVRPSGPTDVWVKLPGYPIEVRVGRGVATVQNSYIVPTSVVDFRLTG